jgi:hypothetical protein
MAAGISLMVTRRFRSTRSSRPLGVWPAWWFAWHAYRLVSGWTMPGKELLSFYLRNAWALHKNLVVGPQHWLQPGGLYSTAMPIGLISTLLAVINV